MNNSAYSTVPCNQHIHELKIFIFTPPQLTWLFFPSLCSCHSFLLAKFRERETQSKKWLPALNRSNFLWAEKAFEFASSTHRQLQYNIAGQNMSTRHQHGWIKACTGSFKTGHMNMEWNWNSLPRSNSTGNCSIAFHSHFFAGIRRASFSKPGKHFKPEAIETLRGLSHKIDPKGDKTVVPAPLPIFPIVLGIETLHIGIYPVGPSILH